MPRRRAPYPADFRHQLVELERAGQYEEAAARYVESLKLNPATLSALLGLERVLVPIDRLPSIVSPVDSALVLQPDNRSIRSLELRVWVTLEERDSLDAAAAVTWLRVNYWSNL